MARQRPAISEATARSIVAENILDYYREASLAPAYAMAFVPESSAGS